jgi:hypothetical protein
MRYYLMLIFALVGIAGMNVNANNAYDAEVRSHASVDQTDAQYIESTQRAQAKALGCTKAPGSKDAVGYAVNNNVRHADELLISGMRHGVDNSDVVSIYRVSVAEAWQLASEGRVWIRYAC